VAQVDFAVLDALFNPNPSRAAQFGHAVCSASTSGGILIMTSVFRTYRVPLATSGLIVMALAAWAWQDWRSFADHVEERERHRAVGISKMLTGAIQSLEDNGGLKRDEIQTIIEQIIRNSPYQFLVLEQNGRRVLHAGDIPSGLVLPSVEAECFAQGFYLFSRKVALRGDDVRNNAVVPHGNAGASPDLGIIGGEQLLILGGDVRDHGYSKALTHMLIPLVVAILLLTASVAAWIMVIRGRLLAEQLRTERASSAHLKDLGLAAAGLAHETKNPLGIISGIAQQIAHNPEIPEQSRVMLEAIIDEVDKSASRLGHFMTFAKQREIRSVKLEIQELTARIAEILQPEFDAAGVTLEVNCPLMTIVADEDMLRQILVNLLLNSLQASPEGSRVEVRMNRHGERAALVVADQGRGILPDLLPDIFKPYVAGNPDGHGLGLAIVKRYVEDHGWTITADSQLNRGTLMTISGIELFHGKGVGDEHSNPHR
jgi:two-component system, NtrC family, sensor histidine kinase HydH